MSRLASKNLRSDNESSKMNMNETVQIIANNVYKEFERMITVYGNEVVEILMPIIVNILENLDELYKTNTTYELEMLTMKEDIDTLSNQYEKEKNIRKQIDEKMISLEFSFDEERRNLQDKISNLESINRLNEVKMKKNVDTISRYEEKVDELKAENVKLYERYTDLFKSHGELLIRFKTSHHQHHQHHGNNNLSAHIGSYSPMIERHATPTILIQNSQEYNSLSSQCSRHRNLSSSDTPTQPTTMDSPENIHRFSHINEGVLNEETISDIFNHQHDFISTTSSVSYDQNNEDNVSCDRSNTSTPNKVFDEEEELGSISKEIETLLMENQELNYTKNALNIVKDDLISKLDQLTMENDMLREDIRMHLNKHSDLSAKVNYLEEELKKYKLQSNEYSDEETLASVIKKSERDPDGNEERRVERTFTRSELSILLQERNHYKERLLELQDALVYKENIRLRRQHADFDENPPGYIRSQSKAIQNQSSIWNFFKNLMKHNDYKLDETLSAKTKSLKSKFKLEFNRSQLYSWSVPRTIIDQMGLPKHLPIPIKVQKIFDSTEIIICTTFGFDEDPINIQSSYFWCIIQSKTSKHYYLVQLALSTNCAQLILKYSIKLKFQTAPYVMCEAPNILFAIKGLNQLVNSHFNDVPLKSLSASSTKKSSNFSKVTPVFHNKVLIKPKNHIGTKTLWVGCEKNQLVVYILFDNNKLEGQMVSVTLPAAITDLKYCFGRVLVMLTNGNVCLFELNRDLNQWELQQCIIIQLNSIINTDVQIKHDISLSNVSYIDYINFKIWLSSNSDSQCFILDLITNSLHHKFFIVENETKDKAFTISAMVKVEALNIIIITLNKSGIIYGYSCENYQERFNLCLTSSIFDLIEPILPDDNNEMCINKLNWDGERLWISTDQGILLTISKDSLSKFVNSKLSHLVKLTSDDIFISSYAFVKSIISLNICQHDLENSSDKYLEVDVTRRFSLDNSVLTNGTVSRTICDFNNSVMIVLGCSYINLNDNASDHFDLNNYAILWKL